MQRVENVLLFLTLLFLPTQLGLHFWPQFSFLYSIKIDYLSPTIYFWDVLVLLLISLFILRNKPVNRGALNIGLLFILAQILSLAGLAGSSNLIGVGPGLVRIEQYLIGVLFGVYIASQDRPHFSKLYWPLSIGLVFITVLAIYQFITGQSAGFWVFGERSFSLSTPAIAKFDYQGIEFLRPYATFSHPNVLAAYLVIVLPLIMLFGKTKQSIKCLLTQVLLVSIALLLTVSRTAIVVGVITAAFHLKGKSILVLIGLLIAVSPVLFARFSSITDFDNLSLSRREQLNSMAVALFTTSPVFGIGLNNFIPVSSNSLLVGPSRFLQPVHNIFLLDLVETGMVGIIGLTAFLGFAIYQLVIQKTVEKHTLLLLWFIVGFLGLFDHYFLTAPQGLRVLMLLWGLSLMRTSTRIE